MAEKEAVVTLGEYQLNQITKFKYTECKTSSKGQIDEEMNGSISKNESKRGNDVSSIKISTCAQER